MKNYILCMILCIVGGCETAAIASDSLIIKFNNKIFAREFPKDYNNSIVIINELTNIIQDFASSVDKIDSVNTKVVSSVDSSLNDIKKYTDSIFVLNKRIKTLSDSIVSENIAFDDIMEKDVDSTNKMIDKIKTKPLFNIGIGIGYYNNTTYVTPILTVDRYFIGANLGIDPNNANSGVKIGGYLGINLF